MRRPYLDQKNLWTSSVVVPAITMPVMLTASWATEPVTSSHRPSPTATAAYPAAGTVVTEMKTPTSADDLPAVTDRTPAAPASSATMNDHLSGLTMNSTSVWPFRLDGVTQPSPRE